MLVVSNNILEEKSDKKQPKKNTKEIKVEHTLVISPKHSEIEHIVIPEKKPRNEFFCCILL